MKSTSLLGKSVLIFSLSLLSNLCVSPTPAMASMKWSPLPEVSLKKGMKAPGDGILVPELNYQNYRALEEIQPELNKIINNNSLPLCSEPSYLESPILWGIVGVLIGGVFLARVIR